MTYKTIKEKLHSYIETGDRKKIKAIYTLLENTIDQERFVYDDELLKALEKRSDDAFSGKVKTFSVKKSTKNLSEHRKKNNVISKAR